MLDTRGPRLRRIVHWGSDLGELSAQLLDNPVTANIQAAVSNVPDDDQVGHLGARTVALESTPRFRRTR